MKKSKKATEVTRWSDAVEGDTGNYLCAVRFDVTDGYVGISQLNNDNFPMDRVLLTPQQFRRLQKFVRGSTR